MSTMEQDKMNKKENSHIPGPITMFFALMRSSKVLIGMILFVVCFALIVAIGYNILPANGPTSVCESIATNDRIIHLGIIGLAWLIASFAVIFFIGWAYPSLGGGIKQSVWHFIDKNLKWFFVIVWIMGFLTYCVGTYIKIDSPSDGIMNVISVVPMSIIYATEMFLGQSDISAIYGDRHDNAFFMMFFNLSHLLAVLCTFIFVLHQFGFFIVSEVRAFLVSALCDIKGREPKNLYVFWGLNERSMILAKSINEKLLEEADEKNSIIIFVRTFDGTDSHAFKMGFERVFSMVKLKNKEVHDLQDLDCLVTTAFHQLSKVEMNKEETVDILAEHLRLSTLTRLINQTTGKVHFFLLNDDEDMNLKCTRRIVYDKTLKSAVNNIPVNVYCHARLNRISRVEQDMHTGANLEVRILDSSNLAVSWLKSKVEYQPVSFVKVDTKDNLGTVTSPFHAMIIGLGETGCDSFRYLYEFSAFLTPESDMLHTERSPFICNIIDENLNEILPYFRKITPALSSAEWNHNLWSDSKHKITYHSINHKSEIFNNAILSAENLKTLNYVVISLGSDEGGVSLAMRILRTVAMQRENLDDFRIFLRVFKQQKAKEIKHILQHYNYIYRQKRTGDLIIPFGDPEELFTYDIIVKDKFRREGMIYYYAYNHVQKEMNNKGYSAGGGMPKAFIGGINEAEAEKAWKERRDTKLSGSKKTFKTLREIRRKESQDMANAYHRQTKGKIVDIVKSDNAGVLSAVQELKLKENLAMTEHLRWNAAHEMMGYTPDRTGLSCDEEHMTHNCLIKWEELDEASERTKMTDYPQDYKVYDRIVVETSEVLNNLQTK